MSGRGLLEMGPRLSWGPGELSASWNWLQGSGPGLLPSESGAGYPPGGALGVKLCFSDIPNKRSLIIINSSYMSGNEEVKTDTVVHNLH